jgi:hypothetical protein
MDIKEVRRGLDWIDASHTGDKWWPLVDIVTNLWFSSNLGDFLIS